MNPEHIQKIAELITEDPDIFADVLSEEGIVDQEMARQGVEAEPAMPQEPEEVEEEELSEMQMLWETLKGFPSVKANQSITNYDLVRALTEVFKLKKGRSFSQEIFDRFGEMPPEELAEKEAEILKRYMHNAYDALKKSQRKLEDSPIKDYKIETPPVEVTKIMELLARARG